MQLSLFNHCAQCGQEHPAIASLSHEYFEGHNYRKRFFCGENCREHFIYNQIRRLEGDIAPVDDPSIDV
jgi:hypothetical protein